jgi:hypothetical protein
MKRFLIILLGLLCAPLVVKGAWELVLWCLSLEIPVFLLALVIAVVLIFLWNSDLPGTNYQPRLEELISMRTAECDSTLENHLIEQINKKYDAAEETLLQKTIAQKCNNEEIQYGKIMSFFTAILFFVPILVGSYKYFGAEAIGNIIVTDDAIYSPKGEIIADPKTDGWKKIEKDGKTYIQYGKGRKRETYDLDGNLVYVEDNYNDYY